MNAPSFRRRPDVLWRRSLDAVVLLPIDAEDPVTIAGTGVDFISVGALTHSAPALDFSLILEPAS